MKGIPIPDFLSHLPTHNGMPIPATVFVAENGVPDFRVTDHRKWHKIVMNRLCGICGEPLGKVVAFIGGEKSMESRFFFDMAMHEQCAEFSARVCPFIALGKSYSMRDMPKGATEIASIPDVKADRMGIMRCLDYRRVMFKGDPNIYLEARYIQSVTWIEKRGHHEK